MICCLSLLLYRRLSVGNYHSLVSHRVVVVLMLAYVENQRKFRKRGTAINTIFIVLMPVSGPPFSKVSDIRSHGSVPARGVSYVPRLSLKPFYAAISEGWHVAVGISSKATDGEDICLKTLFSVFPHTLCFPFRAQCFPPDPLFFQQTPCYPHPAFSTPAFSRLPAPRTPYHGTLAPRFPPCRNGH